MRKTAEAFHEEKSGSDDVVYYLDLSGPDPMVIIETSGIDPEHPDPRERNIPWSCVEEQTLRSFVQKPENAELVERYDLRKHLAWWNRK